jgi:hypothetical protein
MTQLSTVQDVPDGFDETLGAGGGMTMVLTDEAKFYRDIQPTLDVETMAVYFADILDGPSLFLIVAEDTSRRGAQVPDAVEGLTVAQVDQLLATLSRTHPPYWARTSPGWYYGWSSRNGTPEYLTTSLHRVVNRGPLADRHTRTRRRTAQHPAMTTHTLSASLTASSVRGRGAPCQAI